MNAYFEQKILDADPIELVRLVLQRAIACVRDAREHLAKGRILERSRAITKAYAAVSELQSALRPEVAPEFVGRLEALYLYIQRRLLEANVQQADEPLVEVLSLLSTLAEGWNGVRSESDPDVAKDQEWKATGTDGEDTARMAVSA
jgi:flagellar protein FliS